jgi:hypothetical protein
MPYARTTRSSQVNNETTNDFTGQEALDTKHAVLKEVATIGLEQMVGAMVIGAVLPPHMDQGEIQRCESIGSAPALMPRGFALVSPDDEEHWSRLALLLASAKVQIDGLIGHYRDQHPEDFGDALTSAYRILREHSEPTMRLIPVPLNPWSPEKN